jgi:MFS family permease|tara:strand:+ start:304 stop:1509 length:1206 start_codon:yes stop_codon:yes gene_type:complete
LPVPPYYRWYIVALTLVNQALSVGILIYSFALFVVPWLGEFEVSRAQMMLAIFFLQITVGLSSPWLGRLLDQHSIRMLVVIGAFCTSLGLFLLSRAEYFWQIAFVYATFLPVGMVLCGTLASQTLVSKWFVANRSMAIGISATGTSLGGFVFPLVTAELIASFGWETTLLVLSLVAFVVLVPLNLVILRIPPPVADDAIGKTSSIDTRIWTNREILSTRVFWIPVMGLIPMNAAFGGVQFNLGAYIGDLGFDQQSAAQLISITSLSMIVGKFMFGGLGDVIDHRKLYWLMAFLLTGSMLLYTGTPGWTELVLAAILQGVATGGIMPMMGIVYSSRFGTLSFGRVLGFVNLFLMVGSFGSILSGWLFDTFQSYDYAFLTFMFLLLPCVVAMKWLPDPPTNES